MNISRYISLNVISVARSY